MAIQVKIPNIQQQQLKKLGIIIRYLDQFNHNWSLHTPRAQGQTASQPEPLERATLLPGLSPGYIWLCSHTAVVLKYALSKVAPVLLLLFDSVFPLTYLLPVRLKWLGANKSPLYRRCPPGPPNYNLLENCPPLAAPLFPTPADVLSPSVVPPCAGWLLFL